MGTNLKIWTLKDSYVDWKLTATGQKCHHCSGDVVGFQLNGVNGQI